MPKPVVPLVGRPFIAFMIEWLRGHGIDDVIMSCGFLADSVRDVLGESLKAGGTSFDELYVNVNGESGYFDRSLHAYGREGEPCHRCGAPIRREAFMNRSSFSCPRCQPRPRSSR